MTYIGLYLQIFFKHYNSQYSDFFGVECCCKVSEADWIRTHFRNYWIRTGVKN